MSASGAQCHQAQGCRVDAVGDAQLCIPRNWTVAKSQRDAHAGKLVHFRHFDEERGRYAREFLQRRKLLEELARSETGLEKDKGQEFSH